MRTHKKHGILIAGINGFKIYTLNGKWRVVERYQYKDVAPQHESIVAKYVALRYQPLDQRESIVQDFLTFTEGIL